MENNKPKIIKGSFFKDDRGQIDFVNDFNLSDIKRMYFTSNSNIKTIRAWQGHKVENRWFYCVKGAFNVKLIAINECENHTRKPNILSFHLQENKPQVLFIPKGYLNGFKALQEGSKLMILSNYALNEIENDEVRFSKELWADWNN